MVIFLLSCSSQRKTQRFVSKQLEIADQGEQFTGVLMVDLQSGDTLVSWNAERFFTPASNIKLFTLYAAVKTLPSRIPAVKFQVLGDTLHVLGTGDPSNLHPQLGDQAAIDLIRQYPHVVIYPGTLQDAPWGAGWAWDDFDRNYMPMRSSMPIHGNVVRIIRTPDSLQVAPRIFKDSILPKRERYRRSRQANQFFYHQSLPDTVDIPFEIGGNLAVSLWEEATGKDLIEGTVLPEGSWEMLPGISADTLYREMMTVSDNFLAEQLMLVVSATLGDSLSFERARDHVLKTYLPEMPSPPRWVDGSGLSRYNLCTPQSLVYLLLKLHAEVPEERLFGLLAQGGREGTLSEWYRDPQAPYLFGKTGSLSNNHNLSGYLRTQSGRTVVFSFMNNHYRKPTHLVKSRMQRILNWVRENY